MQSFQGTPLPTKRRRRGWVTATGGITALLTMAALFVHWNTNFLGEQEFCDGIVSSTEMSSVLDGAGRISTVSSLGKVTPAFACRVERTSRFLGKESTEIHISTGVHEPDFPFQTRVWKDPSAMSFFSNGTTGAVSGERGWVLLPEVCWTKVGTTQLAQVLPRSGEVTTLDAVIENGTVDRQALAKMLAAAAHRIAERAGCGVGGPVETPRLQPVKTAPTTAGAVCGLPGFTLPRKALIDGEATLGTEQTSGRASDTWACGMHLSGSAQAVIWFSTTSDPRLVGPALLGDKNFRDIADGAGKVNRSRSTAALTCGAEKVFFSMRWSDEYSDATRDDVIQVSRAMFQGFIDSAGKRHGCPAVKLASS
ncbi:hypothetical protein [Streptomyces sp. NPDC126499]|uniref:hypothetical protein n=1 Tax=Streptomyces sp. NPDC126499 TaxID=3155314 RepID=UPI00331764AC